MKRLKIINKSDFDLPEYATPGSAGMDLRSNSDSTIFLNPGERKLISTGLYIELPKRWEAQIRPRSGLALNYGVTVLNSPGTIDSDFRGEICVILINLSEDRTLIICKGDRIAQMVFKKYKKVKWDESDQLSRTERNKGGFGHTKY